LVAAATIVVLLVTSGPSTAGDSRRDSFLARLVPSPDQFRRRASPEATQAMRAMSVEDKVDQLMLLGFEGTDARATQALAGGGEPGGIAVAEENYESKSQLHRLIDETRARARRARKPPPLFMVSQEGGDLSALSDVPPKQAPADTASVEDAAKAALASARELKRIGFDGVLGPVLDVGPSEGGPLGTRVFSDDAREVARYARATVSAYVDEGLISAPLHFPGLGSAAVSTDEGPAQVGQTIDDLRRTDLLSFRVAIDAGAKAMVVGHGLYGTDDFAVPASQSRFLLNDLLRQELGFEGLAITDDLAAGAITISQSSAEAAVASVVAGADMVRLSGPPEDEDKTRTALLQAVRSGRITRERLDSAVLRVLEAKRAEGLLPRASRRGGPRTARPRPSAARPTGPAPPERLPREGRRRTPVAGGLAPPRAEPAPPARPAPPIPGIDVREGRPPGPGGVRERPRRRRRARTPQSTFGGPGYGRGGYPYAGGARYASGGVRSVPYSPGTTTRTYTVPIR
jgi:beta-N-acetylhexosaminidase